MALKIVASRPDPHIVRLPWSTPLEEWGEEFVIPLPRGLSRHVVRIVRLGDRVYAVKETQEPIALREYRLLRDLQRLRLPTVVPQGVVSGRVAADGTELPAVLITEHLRFSLPYRSLFEHGATAEQIPHLVDAMVVLLVRLHLAGFYWGDVSLSNVLFRRDAGAFAAYLVDAETGELQPALAPRMRANDVLVGCENVFGELMDLEASAGLEDELGGHDIVEMIEQRYVALWVELTGAEEFADHEMWRIEQRIERLNDLGFDVDELDIVTDFDGDRVLIQPKVVELGHHQRELQALTGSLRPGQPGPSAAQRHRVVHHQPQPGPRGPHPRRQPLAARRLRRRAQPGAARGPRQAGAGRDLPRDPGAPVVPLGAGRPRGRHLRGRARLHRGRAGDEAGRGHHGRPGRPRRLTLPVGVRRAGCGR